MKVVVLGGDGFCGWPTSLHLSALGHEITIVDNQSRRDIDKELGVQSLTPIADIWDRISAWKERTGQWIDCFPYLNVAEHYGDLRTLFGVLKPDAIIHFAEQRAAPYSMKTSVTKRYTVSNNVRATHNVLCAIVEASIHCHLVHLGTMGVYGYGTAGTPIPEGYLEVGFEDSMGDFTLRRGILHPTNPGSIYHMTKCFDQTMFQFYAKNDKLRITDLHQGIVWGTQTKETQLDERLINRFDFDGDYGTVLNRFLMEAAIGYPLTVHGSGGQTRAFININDTVRCIELALENPPARGERVKILNQMTECHRLIDLANIIAKLTGAEIQHVDNPRKEADSNDLMVCNDSLIKLGLKPTRLEDGLMLEVEEIAKKYASRILADKIPCVSRW